MAERQVSMGGRRYQLPELFMVMATQNPIEHEGTYNLPEAQLDRFLMYIKIDQPDAESERKILHLVRGEEGACGEDISCWQDKGKKFQALDIADILAARQEVLKVHMSEPIEEYLVQLIMATRHPENMMPSWPALFSSAPVRAQPLRWTSARKSMPGWTTAIS